MSGPAPQRIKPGLAVIVLISALQPFALNVLAPATLSMSRSLSTSYAAMQLTLTVYLAAVALSQLIIAPLSDRYGRRPCVLAGVALYTLGSVAGLFADSLTTLLAARALQAVGGGTTFALARAIIRDTAEKDEAASLMGYATMAMVVVPMLAPLTGGWIDAHLGWRAIFLAMAAMGALVGAIAVLRLHESAPAIDRTAPLFAVFGAFPLLLADRTFRQHLVALVTTTCVFFVFIAGAPYIVVEVFGGTARTYGEAFMLNAGGYLIGNFLSGRYGVRFGAERLIQAGLWLSLASLSVAVGLALLPGWGVATLFVPMVFNALGNGLTIPSATASALSVRPEVAGAAAGVAGSLQLGLGALFAYVTGLLVPWWPPVLVVIMWLLMAIAMLGSGGNRFRRND